VLCLLRSVCCCFLGVIGGCRLCLIRYSCGLGSERSSVVSSVSRSSLWWFGVNVVS